MLSLFACGGGGGDSADAGAAADSSVPDSGTPDSGGTEDAGEEPDDGTAGNPVFVLDPAKRDLPVPFDFFTVPDATTYTGLRVSMGDRYSVPFAVGLNFLGAKYPRAIEENDGWSTLAPVLVSLSKRPDTAQFGRTDDFTGADAPIWLFRVPGEGETIAREKLTVAYIEDVTPDNVRIRYLAIRPRFPLIPKAKYALLVRNSLKTASGGAFEASDDFAAVRDGTGSAADFEKAAAIVSPVADLLTGSDPGLSRTEIALLTPFTTMSIVDDYEAIDAMMESGGVKAPELNLDPDGDGKRNVTANGIPVQSSLKVTGTFNSPKFTDIKDVFVHDAGGRPAVQADDELELLMYYPVNVVQPARICIFQHGLGSEKEAMASRGLALPDHGVALIGIDAVTHGSRSPNPGGSSLQFLNVSEPAVTRDNFRQTVIDHMQLERLVKSLSNLDVFPPGPDGGAGGDGTPDLDVSDLCYFGNSLGAIIGGSTMGVTRHIGAGVLNVGGGTLMDFVETFIADKVPYLKDSPEIPLYAVAVQHILDKGDPTPMGRYVTQEPRPFVGRTKQILLQEAINDETVPNATTEHLARGLRLPLIRPFVTDIWGLEQKDAPAEGLGIFQFDPADHNFMFDFSDEPVGKSGARARAQLAEFVTSWLATGTGRIINPP